MPPKYSSLTALASMSGRISPLLYPLARFDFFDKNLLSLEVSIGRPRLYVKENRIIPALLFGMYKMVWSIGYLIRKNS